MPTELPYAAEAESSLSYDELQVSVGPITPGVFAAQGIFVQRNIFRLCFAIKSPGRFVS